MRYDIFLKEVWVSGEKVIRCDNWDISKQGFVVAYDKKERSSIIQSPKENLEPKVFIPRENILCIRPVEG